jgi:hypothetical protein
LVILSIADEGEEIMKQQNLLPLRGVPEVSIFSEFLCGPCQAQEIADTTADHNASGSIDPSKDQGANRHTDCANQRIDKKDLLLVCP